MDPFFFGLMLQGGYTWLNADARWENAGCNPGKGGRSCSDLNKKLSLGCRDSIREGRGSTFGVVRLGQLQEFPCGDPHTRRRVGHPQPKQPPPHAPAPRISVVRNRALKGCD